MQKENLHKANKISEVNKSDDNQNTSQLEKDKIKQSQDLIEKHNLEYKLNLTKKLLDYTVDFSNIINFSTHCMKALS